MKVNIIMPKMGESVMEGTIIKWHKKPGEKVEKDEILFEISTDKVDTEVPSPESGVLKEIKVFEQETVDVDTVVAVIETDSKAEESEMEQTPSTTQVGGEIVDIPMPKMGESVMEGTIIKWYKKVGDEVKKDETLFEITTDKVDTEVPSPVEGTITEIIVGENETVDVDTVVAKIASKSGVVKPVEVKPQEKVKKEEGNDTQAVLERKVKTETNRFYSPLVMNIARKENISFDELDAINGTGINGRVTKKDVLAYLKNRGSSAHAAPVYETKESKPQFDEKDVTHTEREDIIQMDNIRKRIMQHMINSRDTSVHVTGVMEVDMSRVHNYINANRDAFFKENGVKLTYMPFVSAAAVSALKQYPLVNAQIDGDKIRVKKYVNLGIAVAVEPNGLIVPNIKNADEKNIKGLAKAIAELGQKARTKGLKPDDVVDGTFSITNYGVFGTLFGTPIINQPEVAILGVGTVIKKPVVIEVEGQDTIAIKPMMYLTLSHDHRLVDGMLGGRFLKAVKDYLENFDASGV